MISINATLLVQIINLLVLLVIMNYIMYRPLRRLVSQRSETIEQGNAEAKRRKQEALELSANYQRQLRKGRATIQKRLAIVNAEAAKQCEEAIAEAQAKARVSSQAIRERVEQELAQARLDIAKEAELVGQTMAKHILQRGLS